eukprot:1151493-Pelagomonas_calceolata.AAC.3
MAMWDAESGAPLLKMPVKSGALTTCSISPNSMYVATGSISGEDDASSRFGGLLEEEQQELIERSKRRKMCAYTYLEVWMASPWAEVRTHGQGDATECAMEGSSEVLSWVPLRPDVAYGWCSKDACAPAMMCGCIQCQGDEDALEGFLGVSSVRPGMTHRVAPQKCR